MPSCYFTRTPAVRPPQRLLSLALCGWLALFVLAPQGVSADCCPFNGASLNQDSVVIYESAGMEQPPGILPLIAQSNSKVMGLDYPDDRIINVVASQQSGTLKVGHRCNCCERGECVCWHAGFFFFFFFLGFPIFRSQPQCHGVTGGGGNSSLYL